MSIVIMNENTASAVTPAEAGVQKFSLGFGISREELDSSFRWNDGNEAKTTDIHLWPRP